MYSCLYANHTSVKLKKKEANLKDWMVLWTKNDFFKTQIDLRKQLFPVRLNICTRITGRKLNLLDLLIRTGSDKNVTYRHHGVCLQSARH